MPSHIGGFALTLALVAAQADAQDSYRLTKLEGLSVFGDMNERGVVAGATRAANGAEHAAIWYRGRLTDIHARINASAVTSDLRAVNDEQDLVGTFADSTFHGFLVTKGRVKQIPPLPGDEYVFVTDINDRQQIVGGSFDSATALSRQFVWDHGRYTVLRGLSGQTYSIAPNDIDNDGRVVGSDYLAQKAVLWRGATVTDLGGLPGSTRNEAAAINDVGQIVGRSLLSSPDEFPQQVTAFVWKRGVVTALPPLYQGVTESFVHDVNNLGVVVGESLPESADDTVATIWRDGVPHDLNQLIVNDPQQPAVTLLFAAAINDHGQIVAGARAADFSTEYYLLIPEAP